MCCKLEIFTHDGEVAKLGCLMHVGSVMHDSRLFHSMASHSSIKCLTARLYLSVHITCTCVPCPDAKFTFQMNLPHLVVNLGPGSIELDNDPIMTTAACHHFQRLLIATTIGLPINWMPVPWSSESQWLYQSGYWVDWRLLLFVVVQDIGIPDQRWLIYWVRFLLPGYNPGCKLSSNSGLKVPQQILTVLWSHPRWWF